VAFQGEQVLDQPRQDGKLTVYEMQIQ
jgi:hypothetical protein